VKLIETRTMRSAAHRLTSHMGEQNAKKISVADATLGDKK
jgi:hypothetical protein